MTRGTKPGQSNGKQRMWLARERWQRGLWESSAINDPWLLDGDFDDEWRDDVHMRHEIETKGYVELHPNGDRNDCDHIPLHSTPTSGLGEWGRRQACLNLAREEQWRREREARGNAIEKVFEAQERAAAKGHRPADEQRRIAAEHQSEGERRVAEARAANHARHLREEREREERKPVWIHMMKPRMPLARGGARVWMDFVMLNDADVKEGHRAQWAEVWHGEGKTIFRMGLSVSAGDWELT